MSMTQRNAISVESITILRDQARELNYPGAKSAAIKLDRAIREVNKAKTTLASAWNDLGF